LPATGTCRCFESALSITVSIEQGHLSTSPATLDLAFDIEAQLRKTIPLAVHCNLCKERQGEILKMFCNAMANVVDLLEELCNIEFSPNGDMPSSQRKHASSITDGFEWLQPKPLEHVLSSSQHLISHEGNISGSGSHKHGASNDGQYQLHLQRNSKDLSSGRITVGRHTIVGEDRKFVLIHLLRRRLYALSKVLESLIRAIQDLRIALKRAEFSMSYEGDDFDRATEIDTRKPMRTASKLYDIIEQLEKTHV